MTRTKSKQGIKQQKVTFSLENADTNEVFLMGDFNEWNPNTHPMQCDGNGIWIKDITIPPGKYEYKFMVDGKWKEDPKNEQQSLNCFETYNNIINVTENNKGSESFFKRLQRLVISINGK